MFEAVQTSSPQARRREATRREILDAAWAMCRSHGLMGLSMRALAEAVGLKAPTLYAYFDSKHAIYDAMFQQGYEQFEARFSEQSVGDDAPTRASFRHMARLFLEFGVEDPIRYQLLFQRVIPDFEPSAETYALAVEILDRLGAEFIALGIDDPAAVDLWTALSTGLTSQQLTNDPGGDRWARLVDRAVDMFLDHLGIE